MVDFRYLRYIIYSSLIYSPPHKYLMSLLKKVFNFYSSVHIINNSITTNLYTIVRIFYLYTNFLLIQQNVIFEKYIYKFLPVFYCKGPKNGKTAPHLVFISV